MLSVSTKVRYATRALIDIAICSDGNPVPLHEISKRQEISVKYLEALMQVLKSSGMIVSAKGPHGGYLLSQQPNEISLLDIISAFGGPVSLVECVREPSSCNRHTTCSVYDVWKEISDCINAKLKSITIKDFARLQRKKDKKQAELIYHI